MRAFFGSLIAASATVLAACSAGGGGGIKNPSESGPDAGADGGLVSGSVGTPLIGLGTSLESTGACASPTAATAPIRRISRIEYNNAVNALFNVTSNPANDFVPEAKTDVSIGFNTNVGNTVGDLSVQQYMAAAEQIANSVVTNVASVTQCASSSDTACIGAFLTSVARRAWHGTAPEPELLSDYTAAVKALGADQGLRFGVESVLMSPHFLYLVELGSGSGDVVPLTGSEVAGRLAASLWRSVPDAALLADADAGKLDTAAGVMAVARAMLADPRAASMLGDFAIQWLDVEATPTLASSRDTMTWPQFTPQVAQEMLTETQQLFATAVSTPGGTFPQLFTAGYTMANNDLATFYGLKNAPSGSAFQKVDLTPNPERSGLLKQGSVLANHAHFDVESIVLRGKMVRFELLCDPVSPPPPSVNTTITTPDGGGTTERDLSVQHLSDPYCNSCHTNLDPIGFGFGDYDAVGLYKPNGETITSTGVMLVPGPISGDIAPPRLASIDDVSGSFTTLDQLSQKIAGSQDAQQCYVLQVLRYTMGRNEASQDACSAASAWSQFSKAGLDLQEAIVAIAGSDTFRYRTLVKPGEACQ